jgi:hypothetical protein
MWSIAANQSHMHCYFHLVNSHSTIRDDTGVEVPDEESARRLALQAIYDLRQEGDLSSEDWAGWQLDIIDAEGNLVLTIPLNMSLQ